MQTHLTDLDDRSAPCSLAALAEQLRDGPLQELTALQHAATTLAAGAAVNATARIEDLEQLVRLSLSAMQRFNAFTRDLETAIRELRYANLDTH